MMKKKKMILSATLALGASGAMPALAGQAGSWYVAPALSYVIGDDDRAADDDFGLQLGIGKVIDARWNVELGLVMDTLDLKSGAGEFEQRGLLLDALYFLDRDQRFDPYLVGGVGALQTELGSNDDTNLMANVGVGVQHMLNERIALRVDARYRLDEDDRSVAGEDRFGDWIVNLGLAIPFGTSRAAAQPVEQERAPEPAPVSERAVAPVIQDADGDGVADAADRCPNTPAGAVVGVDGCELDADGDGVVDRLDRCPATPAGARVAADGCELDADGDGVVDRLDRCPATPAGARVDARGCELDSDGDGVVDSADACPDSAAGVKVDVRGCEIPEIVVLKGVQFDTGSARLAGDSQAVLDDVAATLKKHPDMKVEVAGHTDNTGPRALNLRLSQARAQAVVDYLINQGVAAAMLSARGYGPDKPVADNDSAAGRAENRRVEMQILE